MKNRSNFSKLTGTLFCAGIVAITGCTGDNINDTTFNSQKYDSGTALVAINVGKVGQLAKRSAIEMEKLIIEIKVKDSVAAIIKDTSSLSGYGKTVITKTFPSLTAPENYVLQAKAFDKTGKLIHSGSKEFSTIPADTVDVSLDLAAMYSMLRVAFNDIPDSVSKVRLKIAAIDTLDSAFTRSTRDTVVFHHDYIPADTIGITYPVSLEASGSFYGKDTVLFAADTTILAKAGKDTSYKIILKWVGPGVPKGAAAMTVIIGSIGTTIVNAGFGIMNVGIPVDGLVAYYPFNGDAKDMSGNGNDGVVNGATLAGDRFGVNGKAYSFDGVNDFINCGNSNLFNVNEHTISAWIKVDTVLSISQTIIGKVNPSIYETFYFGINPPGYLYTAFATGTEKNNFMMSPDTLPNKHWQFVTITYNGNRTNLFINGKLNATVLRSGILRTNSNPVAIGCHGGDALDAFFNGSLDDIRIYNRALTESEVAALYHENGWNGN